MTYLVMATIWIVTSDLLLDVIFPGSGVVMQTFKGLFFVLVTSLILFVLLRRWQKALEDTEVTLERTERIFKTLYDRLDDGVFIIGSDRQIIDCNEAAERLLGYRREELLGESTRRLHVDDEAWRRFDEEGEEALEERGVFRTTFQLKRKDGEVIETEHTVGFVDDAQQIAISIVRDLTETKRSERLIYQQQVRQRALLNSITEIVGVVQEDRSISYINDSARRLLGFAPEELIGTSVLSLVHPEDHERAAEVIGRAHRERGSVQHVSLRAVMSGGGSLPVQCRGISPLGSDLEGIVWSARDVSQEERAQRSLEEKQRMLQQAQKMEALGLFVGGIVHDFNNVLTIILSYSGILECVVEDAGQREDVREIQRAAERAGDISRQLLSFSRQGSTLKRRIDPCQVLRSMREMLRRLLHEDIIFTLELDAETPQVVINESPFLQMVMNLLINARDAMSDGGELTIALDPREPDEIPDWPGKNRDVTEYAHLRVQDTGEGMSEAIQARIFDPFFTTKSVEQGTGLGLATIQQLVEELGGWVEVESAPGEGSVFHVYLPGDGVSEEVEPEAPRPRRQGSGERVLLLEDMDEVRLAVRRCLERANYEVVDAADLEALRPLIAERRFDILVTDVIMPGRSGPDIAAELIESGAVGCVLYISGYSQQELQRRGLERLLDANHPLLAKPFTERQLLAYLTTTLEQRDAPEAPPPAPSSDEAG